MTKNEMDADINIALDLSFPAMAACKDRPWAITSRDRIAFRAGMRAAATVANTEDPAGAIMLVVEELEKS